MATTSSSPRPPGGNNASVVAISRAVWRHSEHNIRGVLEGSGRGPAAVQRRGVGRMTARCRDVIGFGLSFSLRWSFCFDSAVLSSGTAPIHFRVTNHRLTLNVLTDTSLHSCTGQLNLMMTSTAGNTRRIAQDKDMLLERYGHSRCAGACPQTADSESWSLKWLRSSVGRNTFAVL